MRINSTRTINLLVALTLLPVGIGALAGCGSEKADGRSAEASTATPAPPSKARARQVAKAWDGSPAAEVWHKGYYPMGEAVQLPEQGLRSEADKRAYETQNFVLRGELAAAPHENGQVRWKNGSSLTLPLVAAQEAYNALDRASVDGPHLTVTGAKLGQMTLVTSRGPASVPAWLFTVDGYDSPLKRVALNPSRLPKPPISSARETSSGELAPLDRLVEVAKDGRSVTVVATHSSCDDGPAVEALETGGSVVLSSSVRGENNGACTSELRGQEVTVKLDQPIGERILLDAFTGRPVPYGQPNGPSPSWS
ncbi:hypothetical protein [Streptomyces cavernicola]|uniref:Lipoprotein n=1 Tax=Streptomyces cavernicola TaxID=3043613 RepID=A0ABT6SHN0_9ACTN|nr:hypothetical protein [Streptomyces sp. B-S-A6]MDI3407697.1 hypothetical protein [Streptomyces sp. B-S-A6]